MDWELVGPGSKGTGDLNLLMVEWHEMKPNTVWGYLPNLVMPGNESIGNERTILEYVARKCPALSGESDKDWLASQELLHQSEELYQKMQTLVPTSMSMHWSAEKFEKFWTDNNANTQAKNFGVLVYLRQFENFMVKCGAGVDRFTTTGTTIGELKLYATITLVQLVDPDMPLPTNLAAFMKRLNSEAKVRRVMDERLKDTVQYFIKPPSS